MLVESVQRGDIIKSGGGSKDIEVKKVTPNACSSYGTHINDRYCYDRGTQVTVVRPSKETNVSEELIDEILLFEDTGVLV